MLLKAVKAYDGTVIFVSHDTHFIKNLATRILYLSDDMPEFFEGDYDYFSYKLEEKEKAFLSLKADEKKEKKAFTETKQSAHQAQKERRNHIQKLERQLDAVTADIERCQLEIARVDEDMSKSENYSDSVKISRLVKRKEELDRQMESLNEQWFSISSELEEISQ